MGKGRAPTSLEMMRISKDYKDPQQDLFVSMGSNHEERVKNYTSYLDNLINQEIKGGDHHD